MSNLIVLPYSADTLGNYRVSRGHVPQVLVQWAMSQSQPAKTLDRADLWCGPRWCSDAHSLVLKSFSNEYGALKYTIIMLKWDHRVSSTSGCSGKHTYKRKEHWNRISFFSFFLLTLGWMIGHRCLLLAVNHWADANIEINAFNTVALWFCHEPPWSIVEQRAWMKTDGRAFANKLID